VTSGFARRLRTMSRNELSWRVRSEIRTRTEAAVCAIRTPRWNREDVRTALAVETLPPDIQSCIAAADWQGVHDGLRAVLSGRPSRFVLDQAAAPVLQREIASRWPHAAEDATRRAAAVADGSFDLLGYRALSFDSNDSGGIDWHFDPVHRRRMPMAFWSRVPYLDPAYGDHKVIWELNRQQHWLVLSRALWLSGDHAWAREIVRQLTAWLPANPPLLGTNWASMLELAFRSISWLWGLHALLVLPEREAGEAPWLVDLIVALDRQLTHVEHNLSWYFSPNTHLTGEALALYVAGAALPELSASTRWIDTGRHVLLTEIDRQIEPDGGHAERSTHYHRYTLDFYLLALQTARRLGDLEAEESFRSALERIVPFAFAMANRHGCLPLIGDDDGGQLWPIAARPTPDIRDSLGVAAALMDRPALAPWGATEEVLWLTAGDSEAFARALRMDVDERRVVERRTSPSRLANRRMPGSNAHNLLAFPHRDRRRNVDRRGWPSAERGDTTSPTSDERTTRVFAATGFITSATRSGDHLVFDVGPHGYLNGGHAHADALSLVLTLRGQPLLVDPGTPTYTMNAALRDRLRSSANHNTLTIDGASYATPDGPFHWQSRADARLELARFNSRCALFEARHDGYPGVGYRRIVFATDLGYVIADQVTGGGRHEGAQHWHFDPRWHVSCDAPHTLRMTHDNGLAACLAFERGDLCLINGDELESVGWYSPAYGVRVPSWTARVTYELFAPCLMASWCGVAGSGEAPTVERLACESSAGIDAIAIRLVKGGPSGSPGDGPIEAITLLSPGDEVGRSDGILKAADVDTDARAVQCVRTGGRLSSVSFADGRRMQDAGTLMIVADSPVADLHLAREGERIDLTSTDPPATLRLQGPALAGVQHIVANGREARRPRTGDGTTVLMASDWGTSLPAPGSGRSRCAG
jgi:hypothetical protein